MPRLPSRRKPSWIAGLPKTLLIENGAFAAGDRRRISEGIEELRWLAALKPATVGIAAYGDAEREYLEIAVLRLDLRTATSCDQLVELVHRAVPYPMVLLVWRDGTPAISLAHKRRSLGESGATVVDGEVVTARIDGDVSDESIMAFRDSLALTRQPRDSLHAVYQGLDRQCAGSQGCWDHWRVLAAVIPRRGGQPGNRLARMAFAGRADCEGAGCGGQGTADSPSGEDESGTRLPSGQAFTRHERGCEEPHEED